MRTSCLFALVLILLSLAGAQASADDEGKPAMPPTATQLGKDTRLKPHETRSLSYDIPSKDVVLVRGELYFNLLWPVLVN